MTRQRITSITARCLSYHKSDPPMQRGFVVVRVETDGGLVGWGEASSNWGHSYPTVVETVVRDVIAPNLEGADAFAIRARLAQMHVAHDGLDDGWVAVPQFGDASPQPTRPPSVSTRTTTKPRCIGGSDL